MKVKLRARPLLAVAALAAVALAASSCGGATGASHSMQGMHMPGDGGAAVFPPQTRTYYIAADEVQWNYAPTGIDRITGRPFTPEQSVYTVAGKHTIGATYTKALYREYTDASFTTLEPRPADEAYLGFLGPVIRAQVGDTIRVVFRNDTRFPASVHPHGVFYRKDAEGAPYSDGTSGADKGDDAVPPGGTYTYVWDVPARAGPGPMDRSSVMWMYHSHTNEISDTYAGLVGPMIITRRGMARADGSPRDVDHEVINLFEVDNENASPYIDSEIDQHHINRRWIERHEDEFEEGNLMHSINGYVFGNGPMPVLRKGTNVRWYEMSMGTEVDLHTPHWHGNTVLVGGMREDTVSLLPGSMVTADMDPDDAGTWLFHCHVNDHIAAGMLSRYQVVDERRPSSTR